MVKTVQRDSLQQLAVRAVFPVAQCQQQIIRRFRKLFKRNIEMLVRYIASKTQGTTHVNQKQ